MQTTGDAFTVADCVEWFEACGVARFKTPERVHVVSALPLLPTGKVDRQRLALLVPPDLA